MDAERRSRLTILKRGCDSQDDQTPLFSSPPEPSPPDPSIAARERWLEWANELWTEIARVHELVDKVDAEIGRMMSDDCMHSIQVLEKNSEARELQAYYKGLRFAIERRKAILGRVTVDTGQSAERPYDA